MTTFEFTDRLNPIVVKELRQGLRAKTFTSARSVLLIGNVAIAVVAALTLATPRGLSAGPFYLSTFGLLTFLVSVIVPVATYRAFVVERKADAWSTLVITRLSARRILFGKIGAAGVQELVHLSAAGPFLFLMYLLGGVGLPTVLASLAILLAAAPVLLAMAVSAAGLADSKLGSGFAAAALAMGLTGSGAMLVMIVSQLVEGQTPPIALIAVVPPVVTFAGLLFEGAAAALAPTRSVTGVRIALGVHVAGLAAALAIVPEHDRPEAATAVLVWGSLVVIGYGGAAIAAHGAGELRFTLLVLATVLGLYALGRAPLSTRSVDALQAVGGWCVLVLAGPLVVRELVGGRLLSGANGRTFVYVCVVVSLILGAFLAAWTRDERPWFVLNPLLALRGSRPGGLVHVMPVAGVALALLADRLMASRQRAARGGAS